MSEAFSSMACLEDISAWEMEKSPSKAFWARTLATWRSYSICNQTHQRHTHNKPGRIIRDYNWQSSLRATENCFHRLSSTVVLPVNKKLKFNYLFLLLLLLLFTQVSEWVILQLLSLLCDDILSTLITARDREKFKHWSRPETDETAWQYKRTIIMSPPSLFSSSSSSSLLERSAGFPFCMDRVKSHSYLEAVEKKKWDNSNNIRAYYSPSIGLSSPSLDFRPHHTLMTAEQKRN